VREELPPIYPDYTDVTIPYNIAPLNFLLRGKPDAVEVRLKGATKEILIRDSYKVQFSIEAWKPLLEAEKGNTITVRIRVKTGKVWTQYAPFYWHVTPEAIDPYLSYRLIEPGDEGWNAIQIRERSIADFSERTIADNNLTDNACMNYHAYGNQDPNLSFLYVQGAKGGIILNRNGQLRKLNTKAAGMPSPPVVYGNFHPSGRYGVFSTNHIVPAFHTYGSGGLEVYDTESNLVILDFEENKVIPFPPDTLPEKPFRTFPVFSADGTSVYYCEAPRVALPGDIYKLMYSLCRIPFNPATRTFGNKIDTLVNAVETGISVSYPKTSPDGKSILYTVADYGAFPISHKEANLQMMNFVTGEINELPEVNAACSDTYHSWSSTSRWFVFASKRDDGIYGKPYFAYVDKQGTAHKPFVLPQRDPAFYDYTLKSFDIPELSKGRLPFGVRDVERIYQSMEAETMKDAPKDRRPNQ
jgi:hypothetical protein